MVREKSRLTKKLRRKYLQQREKLRADKKDNLIQNKIGNGCGKIR